MYIILSKMQSKFLYLSSSTEVTINKLSEFSSYPKLKFISRSQFKRFRAQKYKLVLIKNQIFLSSSSLLKAQDSNSSQLKFCIFLKLNPIGKYKTHKFESAGL